METADGGSASASQFQRDPVRYRSLQHRRERRSESPVHIRRATSMSDMNREWEEVAVTIRDGSRMLEERIARQ